MSELISRIYQGCNDGKAHQSIALGLYYDYPQQQSQQPCNAGEFFTSSSSSFFFFFFFFFFFPPLSLSLSLSLLLTAYDSVIKSS
jgi:hypothetical protein